MNPCPTVGSRRGPNRRARTGLRALKSRLFLRGLAVIDKRTAAARAYATTRQALLEHLGGPDAVSETQAQLVEMLVRGLLYVGHLDAVLLEARTIVNKKKTKVLPLVAERMRMADGLTRQLQALGLERRTRPVPTLDAYVQARYASGSPGDKTGGGPRPKEQKEGTAVPAPLSVNRRVPMRSEEGEG